MRELLTALSFTYAALERNRDVSVARNGVDAPAGGRRGAGTQLPGEANRPAAPALVVTTMSLESDLYDHYTAQDETPPCPSRDCDCDDCRWRYAEPTEEDEDEPTP